ncbi:MAG: SHOCT domain-containing protein [Clostridiales bacterium]|nr:SHOCT domain-containing protein [Clostridiales bacterium]
MSTEDELLKYKQLLDSGLITQDEFNKAKEQTKDKEVSNDKDDKKTMITTTIFIILLWPVGLIYTLIKKPFKKNTNIVLCVWYAFMTCMLILGIILGVKYSSMKKDANDQQASIKVEEEKKQAYDVNKFANISSSELKEIFGEPDHIEEGTRNDFVEIPVIHYEYKKHDTFGDITFELLNDKVIDFNATGNFSYDKNRSVLRELGVEREDTCATVIQSDTEERYRCPSQTIDDLWVSGMDNVNGTFKYLKVTYDMKYFEEWFIPMSTEEVSMYQSNTQNSVKAIMKSSETAVFPDITEWSFGKNDYYVAVQSYVNGKNTAGELVKSEFTFVYKANTQELIYATYDGKLISENDYIDTKEILIKLLSEETGNTTENAPTVPIDGSTTEISDSTSNL